MMFNHPVVDHRGTVKPQSAQRHPTSLFRGPRGVHKKRKEIASFLLNLVLLSLGGASL